ncbi:MAG: hypothetical protein J6S05_05390 [Bacteroidaceae bacterium]|nr:hypothetical protein [Bacteroidaceae bacterium]
MEGGGSLMDMEQVAVQLQKIDDRSVRNEGRIKKLESEHEALHQLATSVAIMAEKMDVMNASVDKLTSKVEELEAEPGKRWKFVIEKAIYFVVAAVVGFILARVGL